MSYSAKEIFDLLFARNRGRVNFEVEIMEGVPGEFKVLFYSDLLIHIPETLFVKSVGSWSNSGVVIWVVVI